LSPPPYAANPAEAPTCSRPSHPAPGLQTDPKSTPPAPDNRPPPHTHTVGWPQKYPPVVRPFFLPQHCKEVLSKHSWHFVVLGEMGAGGSKRLQAQSMRQQRHCQVRATCTWLGDPGPVTAHSAPVDTVAWSREEPWTFQAGA
jgi:hypothetical protein